jgi:hypothetical protein
LAHALQKQLAQPRIVAAQATVLHGIRQACAVVAILVAKAAGLGQGQGLGGGHARAAQRTLHRSRVARHGVGGLGACGQGDGLVDQRHEGRKLVAVGAGDAEQHIDPLAAQLRVRDQFHRCGRPLLSTPAARPGPPAPALPSPWWRSVSRPERQRQALRHAAAMGSTPVVQPLLEQTLRHFVGLARGQAAGVQPVRLRPVGRLSGLRIGSPP